MIVWVALVIRIGYITLARTYHFPAFDDHAEFGREMGRIARALVMGRGYADPFDGQTGPTAWVAPLYPLLLAAIFKVFGVYSYLSGWTILAANSVFSALTTRGIYEIGARCFNGGRPHKSVALYSAWIWALYFPSMQFAVRYVWETSLSTWLFTLAIVVALRVTGTGNESRKTQITLGESLTVGAVWGCIGLSNPSLLIALPCVAAWILIRLGRPGLAHNFAVASLGAVVCATMIGGWTARNWVAFHRFVPMRANLGTELYLANGPGAWGLLMDYDHPFYDANQLRVYAALGELKYSKMRGDLAKTEIARAPAHFVTNSLRRAYFYWFGLPHPQENRWVRRVGDKLRLMNYELLSLAGLGGAGLAVRRKVPGAALFVMVLITVPLIYYLVTAHARFRHPLEPLLILLGTYLFQSAGKQPEAA